MDDKSPWRLKRTINDIFTSIRGLNDVCNRLALSDGKQAFLKEGYIGFIETDGSKELGL